MIRSEQAIIHFDFARMRVEPDRLRHGRDDAYLAAAGLCLATYRQGVGRSRKSLHREIETIMLAMGNCPPRRIASFCKLLDDASEYVGDAKKAVALRRRVFGEAASMHPIVTRREGIFEHDLENARAKIVEIIGKPWERISDELFSDVIELQKLKSTDESIGPSDLLSRYNVAQTQAALYRASRVRIEARSNFRLILSQAKLGGLMHRIERLSTEPPVYRFDLDGPGSLLRKTTRYGIRFAQMIPTLLVCDDWNLRAEIVAPGKRLMRMNLSSTDGLRSTAPQPPTFDSELEQRIDAAWQKAPISGWTCRRETEFLVLGQSVMTPDFVMHNVVNGRKLLIEVVGYWTPEYIAEKAARLRRFVDQTIGGTSPITWLLMFEKGPLPESLCALGLPMIIVGKRTAPSDWLTAAMRDILTGFPE